MRHRNNQVSQHPVAGIFHLTERKRVKKYEPHILLKLRFHTIRDTLVEIPDND